MLRVLMSFGDVLTSGTSVRARSRSIVGAIRWDAWYGAAGSSERTAVEATLGPAEFQSRAPDFAVPISHTSIRIDGGTQAEIDREIRLASQAGIDYWAYCFYSLDSPMMNAWKLHQISAIRDRMKWCLLLPSFAFFESEMLSSIDRYVGYMIQSTYQRVLGGRPLLFVLDDATPAARLRAGIDMLRRTCTIANGGNPYIAIMSWSPLHTRQEALAAGADAISAYSVQSPKATANYNDLDRAMRAEWAEMAEAGIATIPLAVTGKDRRPRVKTPVPWETGRQQPMVGYNQYFVPGRPEQIGRHVRAAVDWVDAHPADCPARCSIIYSWNECDEGGSTLLPTRGQGETILKAIGRALR
ncbi:MAG: hypothetical protein ACRYG8_34355 [Janthinobacterium lividum]